jgi:hypothetical protein
MLVPRAMVRRAEGLILTVVLTIIGGITMPPPTGHLVALGVRIAKGGALPARLARAALDDESLARSPGCHCLFFCNEPDGA